MIRRFMKELRLTESEIRIELNKPIRIPIRLLTQAENAANLTAKPELESEEPELEGTKQDRIEPEPEEPERIIEPETEPDLEPEEPKDQESEPKRILEPEPEIEPERFFELEPEPEPELRQLKKKTVEELFGFKKTF
jgi:hypothetical protein